MTIAITFEKCCGEADASLGIIDADSGAGGVELVSVVLTALNRVGQPRGAEECTVPVMDGWVDCLTDDYIGTPVKISVFFYEATR